MGKNILLRMMTSLMIVALMSLMVLCLMDDAEVEAHNAEDVQLDYYYTRQVLNVTITHPVRLVELSTHYIDEVAVSKNGVVIIDETYDSQPSRDTFSYEYPVEAEDGDVLEVYVHCSWVPEGTGTTESITVEAPRNRMVLSAEPDVGFLVMGDEKDFTILAVKEDNDNEYIQGIIMEGRADLGEVTEVQDLGMGAYQFTYTTPELDEEDIEVINITATKNGYHDAYMEFSFDILFPADPDKVLDIIVPSPFTSIKEGQTKELTVDIETKTGDAVDVSSLTLDRSGGQVSQQNQGNGKFTITFKANPVTATTQGWIKITAEKEGYQRAERTLRFTIEDVPDGAADDDDGNGDIESGDFNIFEGNNIVILIVVLIMIAGIIAFIVYRRFKKKREEAL
ncbi:MAG: FeoB-associated Cys-rich membrane protein [Thermoplasmatota archaeon]